VRLKITASSFASKVSIEVHGRGVTFIESVFLSNKKDFEFGDIDCVLMSEDNILSFQVKQEVFSIPVKPNKDEHKQVIDALVREVNRSYHG